MPTISTSQIRYVWVTAQSDGTIDGHHNGASVVKNATGDFTVTYYGDMPTENYFVGIFPKDNTANPINIKIISQTKNSARFSCYGGAVDVLGINVISSAATDPAQGFNFLACA